MATTAWVNTLGGLLSHSSYGGQAGCYAMGQANMSSQEAFSHFVGNGASQYPETAVSNVPVRYYDRSQAEAKIVAENEWRRTNSTAGMEAVIKQSKRGGFMESVKSFFHKNADTIFTILLVIAVDEWILGGVLREKLKGLIEGIVDRKHKEVTQLS